MRTACVLLVISWFLMCQSRSPCHLFSFPNFTVSFPFNFFPYFFFMCVISFLSFLPFTFWESFHLFPYFHSTYVCHFSLFTLCASFYMFPFFHFMFVISFLSLLSLSLCHFISFPTFTMCVI